MSNTRHATGVPGLDEAVFRAMFLAPLMLERAGAGDAGGLAALAEQYEDDPTTLGVLCCMFAQELARLNAG